MMFIEPVDNALVCVDESGEVQGKLCERIEFFSYYSFKNLVFHHITIPPFS